MAKVFRLLLLLPLLLAGMLAAASNVTLTDHQNEYTVSAVMDILEDETASLTIDDILSGKYEDRFKPSPGQNPANAQSESNFWLRFTINNSSSHDDWLLELRNGYVGIFDLYTVENGTYSETQGGFYRPFASSRYLAYEFLTHNLAIKPGETKTPSFTLV